MSLDLHVSVTNENLHSSWHAILSYVLCWSNACCRSTLKIHSSRVNRKMIENFLISKTSTPKWEKENKKKRKNKCRRHDFFPKNFIRKTSKKEEEEALDTNRNTLEFLEHIFHKLLGMNFHVVALRFSSANSKFLPPMHDDAVIRTCYASDGFCCQVKY